MSIDAISSVDSDFARVASAQLQLASARSEEVPISSGDPSRVEQGRAAVAAAEAALAAAQAALSADEAALSPAVTPPDASAAAAAAAAAVVAANAPSVTVQSPSDPTSATPPLPSTHYIDTTA